MRFVETPLAGAYVVDLAPVVDERGHFARAYCSQEFSDLGLHTEWPQANLSRKIHKHTLRGMHYQVTPHEEVKFVRCVRGAIYDVIVDLRPASPTWGQSFGVELDHDAGKALYIPKGFAHGFLSLVEDTDVFYQMGAVYVAGAAAGFRYNDPAFGIAWPCEPAVISERDANYPDFEKESL